MTVKICISESECKNECERKTVCKNESESELKNENKSECKKENESGKEKIHLSKDIIFIFY